MDTQSRHHPKPEAGLQVGPLDNLSSTARKALLNIGNSFAAAPLDHAKANGWRRFPLSLLTDNNDIKGDQQWE
ncbi:MAG: hypothetical protein Q8O81_16505 [Giesbergeria sp.]|nr:hypothetical protein [Giesbergeria sp.]